MGSTLAHESAPLQLLHRETSALLLKLWLPARRSRRRRDLPTMRDGARSHARCFIPHVRAMTASYLRGRIDGGFQFKQLGNHFYVTLLRGQMESVQAVLGRKVRFLEKLRRRRRKHVQENHLIANVNLNPGLQVVQDLFQVSCPGSSQVTGVTVRLGRREADREGRKEETEKETPVIEASQHTATTSGTFTREKSAIISQTSKPSTRRDAN